MAKYILFIFSLFISTISFGQEIEPIFKCSKKLVNPYGMCAHFTFTDKKADNTTMDAQAKMLHELGCNIVRSDLTYRMVNSINPSVLDKVLKVENNNHLYFLGIATDPRLSSRLWSNNNDFNKLVNVLNIHYKNINYLELQNEVNYSKLPNLGRHYTDDLVLLNGLKKRNKHLKVLFSGIGDIHFDFLDSAMTYGAYRFFDIMNFHTYREPEDIPTVMNTIHNNMEKYHWSKPIWMTECGMHTAKYHQSQTNFDFYTKVIPVALKKIGIKINNLSIGIINDPAKGYYSLNDDEIVKYVTNLGAKPVFLSFRQLSKLEPSVVPVLYLAQTERFYGDYFPAILEYVRKGGTIVLPFGAPFYYDSSNNKAIGKTFANQLHVGQLYYWDGEAKKLSAPEHPTFYSANKDFGIDYSFYKVGDNMTPRYLTEALLKSKDKMIPISYAGNDKYKGVVAALYQLNSDLKGNIIIQTRMGTHRLVDMEDEQARRVARIHLIAFAYGVDKVFWYKFRSNEIDPYYSEDNFGIVHADLSPKPAYYAYKTLIQMLPNGSTRPTLSIKDGVYKAGWKRSDGKTVTAYWTKAGFTYQQVDSSKYSFYDYMGKEVNPQNGMVRVSSGIIYAFEKSR